MVKVETLVEGKAEREETEEAGTRKKWEGGKNSQIREN